MKLAYVSRLLVDVVTLLTVLLPGRFLGAQRHFARSIHRRITKRSRFYGFGPTGSPEIASTQCDVHDFPRSRLSRALPGGPNGARPAHQPPQKQAAP